MAPELEIVKDIARYASLGLIANPFALPENSDQPGIECEIGAEGNALLQAILRQSAEESPKPLWVEKSADMPSQYPLMAIAHAESSLAVDDSLNVMYAYVQLYTFKKGVVRSTLGVLAERVAFRDFDKTLAAYLEQKVLAEPDTELTSYQVLGPQGLDAFAAKFREDPLGTVHACFGDPLVERRPDLDRRIDMRPVNLEEEVEESDTTAEFDASMGDAPGTDQLLEERAQKTESDEFDAVRDYVIEYAKTHLSTVIARGLRVFYDRGLAAMATEFQITKAPRKSLAALIDLANYRYRKVALIFDSFEQWLMIEDDLRPKIVGSLSELRWKVAGGAFLVMLVETDAAPELEEAFRTGSEVVWDFPGVIPLQDNPDVIDHEIVNRWLANAASPGADLFTMSDPILAKLADEAQQSLRSFITMAGLAFEDAADRQAQALDEAAFEAGIAGQ